MTHVSGFLPGIEKGVDAGAGSLGDAVDDRVEAARARAGEHVELDRVVSRRIQMPCVHRCARDLRPVEVGRLVLRGGDVVRIPAVWRLGDPDASSDIELGDGASDPDGEAHAPAQSERDAQHTPVAPLVGDARDSCPIGDALADSECHRPHLRPIHATSPGVGASTLAPGTDGVPERRNPASEQASLIRSLWPVT